MISQSVSESICYFVQWAVFNTNLTLTMHSGLHYHSDCVMFPWVYPGCTGGHPYWDY